MIKYNKIIFFIAIAVFLIPQASFASKDGDSQYWNAESISTQLSDSCRVELEEGFRVRADASDFYHHYSDLGIAYCGISEWFEIGLNYRLVYEENNDQWKYENRPHFNATLKHNLEGFKLNSRSRFEYREKEAGNDGWRYRNKFTVKFAKYRIQPYAADEFFIDFDKEDLNQNRLYAGIEFKITKNLKGDIYYLWQLSESKNNWTDDNILGTKLKLSF